MLAAAMPTLGQAAASNPLLEAWQTPFGVPPFTEVKEEHFLPAIKDGMARQRQEVAGIAALSELPSFGNTIEALERSGRDLERANNVFGFLTGAETNDKLQALARELAPLQSAHRDAILLDAALFRRIKTVWDARASPSHSRPSSRCCWNGPTSDSRGAAPCWTTPAKRNCAR